MKSTLVIGVLTFSLVTAALLTGPVMAEVPDTFTNLKVFPKDIGKLYLMGAMKDFSTSLGVSCTHCHLQKTPGDFDSIDWADDSLEDKEVARGMITMTKKLNSDFIPQATGKQGTTVKCVTCHRGLKDPRTLDRVLLDTIEKDGVEVGISRYRELKKEYYGSGSYDFSPSTLTVVAETLAQSRGDMDGAVAVLDLAVEMNPGDLATHLMRCQVLIFHGDKEGALASAQEVLKIDPDHEVATRLIEQIDH